MHVAQECVAGRRAAAWFESEGQGIAAGTLRDRTNAMQCPGALPCLRGGPVDPPWPVPIGLLSRCGAGLLLGSSPHGVGGPKDVREPWLAPAGCLGEVGAACGGEATSREPWNGEVGYGAARRFLRIRRLPAARAFSATTPVISTTAPSRGLPLVALWSRS